MTCKQTLHLKFGDMTEFEATYDFGWINIKVDVKIPIENRDPLTAKQLRQTPIKTAIKQLQDLLAEEESPQEQGHKPLLPGASGAPDAA